MISALIAKTLTNIKCNDKYIPELLKDIENRIRNNAEIGHTKVWIELLKLATLQYKINDKEIIKDIRHKIVKELREEGYKVINLGFFNYIRISWK